MNWDKLSVQSYIAVLLSTATVALIFLLVLRPMTASDDVTKTAIGALLTVGFATIISFYFGSSQGSKAKDDTLNQIALQPAPAAVVALPPAAPQPVEPAPQPAPPPAVAPPAGP